MFARVVHRWAGRLALCLQGSDGVFFAWTEGVAFDTGYAGPNGTEPQSWVNGNGTSYIYFGSGQFDGQGSGHDFSGTVSSQPTCSGIPRAFRIQRGVVRAHTEVLVWTLSVLYLPWFLDVGSCLRACGCVGLTTIVDFLCSCTCRLPAT